MLMPLLTAGFALGTGVAVIGLLSHAITMASFSSRALAADRPRGRRRLRALHRHPLPPGTAARAQSGGGDRRRARHLGAGGPVRRDHRLHRPARHVHARRQLPLRRRDRRLGGRRDDRLAALTLLPGAARLRRPPHPRPQNAGGRSPRGTLSESDESPALEPLGRRPAAPPGALRGAAPPSSCW